MRPIAIGDTVGDYIVIDAAGSGGMGTVYKIEHAITKRIEAMKLLPPGLSSEPDQVRRFEREIQVQARLQHPNIVTLYNAVHAGDSVALVMEFVEGESLQRILQAGPLPIETAVGFASQVLGALAYAHDAGVIHRDVSPANIIVTAEGVAKLTDFGLALGAGDLRLSTSGAPVGSPWYMSPEQVRGNHGIDRRTDLYAMGAVLFEVLTGGKLFEGDGAFAIMRAHVEMAPPLASARNPDIPPALDQVIATAVAKNPANRFQSADEFRAALRNLAVDAPPKRSRPKSWRRAAVLAAIPPALAAAVFAIGFFPAAQRQPLPPPKPPAAPAVMKQETIPDPPPPDLAPPVEPAPAAIVEPRRAPSRKKPLRRTPIRSAAAEPQPAPPEAIAMPDPPQPAQTLEPVASKPNVLDNPKPEPEPPEPVPPSSDAVPEQPKNAGNPVVRALGKVNPFRWLKRNPAKNSVKKD